MSYDKGSVIRVTGMFTDQPSSQLVDPAGITFKAKSPTGVTTTYIYGTDVQVVRETTGVYHVDLNANEAGPWTYRFESSGTYQGAVEGSFAVATSVFG